ncbi:hypothetical protein Rhopal_003648-T1 [Rhodotorula paludigena]|uniref:Glycosyltransferase 2-like domain-containing protein n=1 Tax=Rhodotorula paludigena TaxID=86838 RepID=A0AAV5GE38_9BASI|nr:hypothetical protein Rhopal_003648-T1 [Rhodotorula paludigena]
MATRRPSLAEAAISPSRRVSHFSTAASSRRSSFAESAQRQRSIRTASVVSELGTDLAAVAQAHKRQFLMAEHIFRTCEAAGYFPDADWGNIVAVRTSVGTAGTSSYASYPLAHEVDGADILLEGLACINAEAAVIVSSHVCRSIVSMVGLDEERVTLNQDCAIQIIDHLEDLKSVKRHQYAAFVRSNSALVLWSDDVASLVPHARQLSDQMLDYIWREHDDIEDVKEEVSPPAAVESGDEEQSVGKKRPIGLLSPLHVGLAVGINVFVSLLTLDTLIVEYMTDGSWPRLFIALAIPLQFFVSQFFCVIVVAIVLQLIGPVKQMAQNNKYYSGERPPRMPGPLPHFTILMPVYKEGLESVLQPTIRSLQDAIKTYELQGGSVSILVCDDGMQLLNERDFATRKAFYEANAIAYVARPGHGKHYKRAGRFKKSSNLNVALELSIRIETLLKEKRPERTPDNPWTYEEDQALYQICLEQALAETQRVIPREEGDDEKDEKPKTLGVWASGDIRIGELILIIDSDTRVPVDCFLDAASEMHWSPECAIIQHVSDVMLVGAGYFENFIAFFTRLVNTSIAWVTSNGDVGCFVGHNAFIRWSALQEIAQLQPSGRWQIWSESHVSEDFDCALRMLVAGYDVRFATYSKGGFEEGVSLTCDDELNRWQKYAYGVSELLIHPLKKWPTKGIFTPMAKDFFLHSNLPLHYKFSSLAYLSSYYGISVAFPLSVAGYLLYGMLAPSLDSAYLPSWKVNVALFVVFGCASALAFALLRYRSGQCGLHTAVWEQAKWTPCNTLFFMGLSFHVLLALLAHPVGYDMQWSATVKEATDSTVFDELPAIFKRYRVVFTACGLCIVMMLLFAFLPFMEWAIIDWVSIVPLALVVGGHFLFPFFLNPTIMSFRF